MRAAPPKREQVDEEWPVRDDPPSPSKKDNTFVVPVRYLMHRLTHQAVRYVSAVSGLQPSRSLADSAPPLRRRVITASRERSEQSDRSIAQFPVMRRSLLASSRPKSARHAPSSAGVSPTALSDVGDEDERQGAIAMIAQGLRGLVGRDEQLLRRYGVGIDGWDDEKDVHDANAEETDQFTDAEENADDGMGQPTQLLSPISEEMTASGAIAALATIDNASTPSQAEATATENPEQPLQAFETPDVAHPSESVATADAVEAAGLGAAADRAEAAPEETSEGMEEPKVASTENPEQPLKVLEAPDIAHPSEFEATADVVEAAGLGAAADRAEAAPEGTSKAMEEPKTALDESIATPSNVDMGADRDRVEENAESEHPAVAENVEDMEGNSEEQMPASDQETDKLDPLAPSASEGGETPAETPAGESQAKSLGE
jgi:hypothetical protein